MKKTNFETHLVFERLEQLETRLQDQELKKIVDLDNFNYFNTVTEFIKDRLKITIPTLVLDADLDNLAQEILNALDQIDAFVSNRSPGHLNNASNNFNSCIVRTRNLPFPFAKSDFNFSKSVSNFQKTVKEKLDLVENENKSIAEELENLRSNLVEKETKLLSLADQLSSKEQEIINLNNSFQNEFNNIKSSSVINIDTDRQKFRSEIDLDKEEFRKEFDNLKSELLTESGKTIEEMNSKLNESKKIVNIIGNVGVTGNFRIIANYHMRQANIMRYVALALMAILSTLLILTIWDISSDSYDWKISLIRIIAAAVLSYPATYAAQESSKHRKQENYNRKIELELASINPFIELLDDVKKQEIKEKLVAKYFGNSANEFSETAKEPVIPVSTFERILKTVGNILNK